MNSYFVVYAISFWWNNRYELLVEQYSTKTVYLDGKVRVTGMHLL